LKRVEGGVGAARQTGKIQGARRERGLPDGEARLGRCERSDRDENNGDAQQQQQQQLLAREAARATRATTVELVGSLRREREDGAVVVCWR
jgi:hypothetical protein